jgi:hypothetical protein
LSHLQELPAHHVYRPSSTLMISIITGLEHTFGCSWTSAEIGLQLFYGTGAKKYLRLPQQREGYLLGNLLICPCALPRRSVAKACALRLSRCPGSTIDSPLQTRRCRETTNCRLVRWPSTLTLANSRCIFFVPLGRGSHAVICYCRCSGDACNSNCSKRFVGPFASFGNSGFTLACA